MEAEHAVQGLHKLYQQCIGIRIFHRKRTEGSIYGHEALLCGGRPYHGGDERDHFGCVHYSGLNMEGFKSLEEGASVEYDVIQGEKGPQAVNVNKL